MSTTNHTWNDLGLNLGLCGEKSMTICMSYGTAFTMKDYSLWKVEEKVWIYSTADITAGDFYTFTIMGWHDFHLDININS